MSRSPKGVWSGAVGLAGALAGAGAVLLVIVLRPAPSSPVIPISPERVSITARCALASSEDLEAGAIHIRCGLEEGQIAALVQKALADLGLAALVEQARRGEVPDNARLAEAAGRVGTTPENLRAAILRFAAASPPAAIEIGRPPAVPRVVPLQVNLPLEEPPAVPRRMVELKAECAVVAGRAMHTADVDIQCLRKEDVTRLVDTLLIEAKIDDLVADLRRAALTPADATRRVAEAIGFAPTAAAGLLEGLDLQSPDAVTALKERLRARLDLVSDLLRVHATTEGLRRRRDAIADALSAGDAPRATHEINGATTALDAALGQLDPGRDVEGLVTAAARIREANDLLEHGQRQAAAARLKAAADALAETQALARAGLRARVAELTVSASANDLADTTALPRAAELYREAAAALPRPWVEASVRRAEVLMRLGERRGDPASLREAAAALGEALGVLDGEVAPELWVAAQTQLGITLLRLGEITGDTAAFDRSAAAYEAAIARTDRDVQQKMWTNLQLNLTSTLSAAASRTRDPERLRAAVQSFAPLLETVTRERDPANWAVIQHNRALVLSELARLQRDAGTLEEAVVGFEQALSITAPEANLAAWVKDKAAVAAALHTLGTWRHDQTAFTRAAEGYEAILQRIDRENHPMAWASAQSGLGQACLQLWFLGNHIADAEAAIRAQEAARARYDRELHRHRWALATQDLGISLAVVADARRDKEAVMRSVALLGEAVVAFEAEGEAWETAYARFNLGLALSMAGDKRQEALQVATKAREEFTALGDDAMRKQADASVQRMSARIGAGTER